MKHYLVAVGLCSAALVCTAQPAAAVTYFQANFGAAINPGNANVKSPFTALVSQGQALSGSFVFENELVPGSGSGVTNVSTALFPDIAIIPLSSLFSINLGALNLTAANVTSGETLQIQYKNGVFAGFAGPLDFLYEGSNYRLAMQGSTFSVVKLINGAPEPLGPKYINGKFDSGFTNAVAYTPSAAVAPTAQAVPEPATWAMFILGMGVVGWAMRRQRASVRYSFA